MISPLAPTKLTNRIRERAFELGFDPLSFTSPQVPLLDQQAYLDWCRNGHAGAMAYMTREPKARIDLNQQFPNVKTVLTLGVSYYQGPWPEKPGIGFGKVARYAWGLDYHDVILNRLEALLEFIHGELGSSHKAKIAVDTQPILERALAKSGGMGFIGKNTVLIVPQKSRSVKSKFHVGSWIFLGEVLLDIPLEDTQEDIPKIHGCGSCTKCLSFCPTHAFSGPYDLDSNRCISYLTIENKGWIPRELRSQMGHWVFGCDGCQDVCPFNARSFETRWPEFKSDHGVGPWISLKDILSVPDQATFKHNWGDTPLGRPKRRGMVRNACVAAGNSKDEGLVSELVILLEDPESIIRGHALWALSQLDIKGARKQADKMVKNDPDTQVQHEGEEILNS